ncbi:MAG: pyruvate kinase [Actinomycetota bacterium]
MNRRTKIICTIGPASDDVDVLQDMIRTGMDVGRIGMAHASVDEGLARSRRIREAAANVGKPVGVLVDLPGPKIRVGAFSDDGAELVANSNVQMRIGSEASSGTDVFVDYDGLLDDVHAGDELSFGDGGVVVRIEDRIGDALQAVVLSGGVLRGRPGVHIPSDRLSVRAPTDDDLRMLDAFLDEGVDMVALSFVRSGSDMRRLGTEPHPRGPLLVAKIENRAAVDNLDGIIEESGAIMVARGDLGSECSLAELPHLQKEIIERCIAGGLPVITATQMLETMITAPAPTRAEASDVANAVFDGTSAVMLSGETAIGAHPVRVVETMAEIASVADERFDRAAWAERLESLHLNASATPTNAITDAMTSAAARACEALDIAAILAISGTGFTVRSMARFRPRANILGFTTNPNTYRQLTSSWGTVPMEFESTGSYEERVAEATQRAKAAGLVQPGDLVGVLAGIEMASGATDVFRILPVR